MDVIAIKTDNVQKYLTSIFLLSNNETVTCTYNVDDKICLDGIEFQKVKHVKWTMGDKMKDYPRIPYKPWMTYCSECGAMSVVLSDFCADCGARMDGKEDST